MIDIVVTTKGGDRVQRFLNAIADLPKGKPVKTAMGASARNTVREHLYEKDAEPNKMGAPKTHYYRQAGDATSFRDVKDGVRVSVKQVGILQRVEGGVITPKNAKALTIPLTPVARGRRAREFSDLFFLKSKTGKSLGVLAREKGSGVEALYVLRRSVTQQPDDTVLPEKRVVIASARRGVERAMDRFIKRGGVA